MSGLAVLAVDDERPALEEIDYLLTRCYGVDEVVTAESSTQALRYLRQRPFDVILLDIRMPGLDGLELASLLEKFASPPAVVFVTAHEEHALQAFEVHASAYLLKPVGQHVLQDVLDRIAAANGNGSNASNGNGNGNGHNGNDHGHGDLETIAADTPGRTTLVSRSEVEWVEAAGDYIRLHTSSGHAYLIRLPMAVLESKWSDHGFARIHRSYLVALRSVRELRAEGAQTVVRIGHRDLPVSRRHLGELRARLIKGGR